MDEPKLSVRKMDPSRPISDLDDEAQAKIEQMMWDDHRKKQGLPGSQEMVCVNLIYLQWDVCFCTNCQYSCQRVPASLIRIRFANPGPDQLTLVGHPWV